MKFRRTVGPIQWERECEDTAHKPREKDRGDWKREQSQREDRFVCREEGEKMSAERGRKEKRGESKEVMEWL